MSQQISGLIQQAMYIDSATEADLIKHIDHSTWSHALRRRTQHYGYRYSYRDRSASEATFLGPLPKWVAKITHQLKQDLKISHSRDQVIVNEYVPGQGIAPHIDCPKSFVDPIVSLSLGAGCEMEFSRGPDKHQIYLEPRSLLLISGEARYSWRHGIRPRKSDVVLRERRLRQRRLSLTFRWLKKQH